MYTDWEISFPNDPVILDCSREISSASLLFFRPSYTALEIDIFAGDRTLGTDDTRPVLEDVRDSVQADKTYTDSDVFHIGNLDHDHCELTGLIRASLSRGDGRVRTVR